MSAHQRRLRDRARRPKIPRQFRETRRWVRRREHRRIAEERRWRMLARDVRRQVVKQAVQGGGFESLKPRVGDLVVEASSFRVDPDGLGILLGHGYDEDDRETFSVQPLRLEPAPWIHHWRNAEFYPVTGEALRMVQRFRR